MDDNQFLLASEGARVVGVSVFTFRAWVDAGKVKGWKTPSGTRLVSLAECLRIKALREAGHVKAAA